jgi:hypothetical protein
VNGRITRAAISVAAVACCVLGTAAAASASNASLRAVIKSDAPSINRSQARILDGIATYQKTHSSKALISAIAAQDRTLTALESKVANQSASTNKGTKGKNEILSGLRLAVGSNSSLSKDLKASSAHKPASKAQLKAAAKEVVKGNNELNAGLKLLSK